MSRARHKHRSKGGVVAYSGGGSNVMKEAHERKRGGRVHHMEGEGEEAHERHDRKRRHGGRMMKHEHEHEKHRKRGGRVHHRAKGGEVGANEKPLSTAARTTKLKGEGPENFPSD